MAYIFIPFGLLVGTLIAFLFRQMPLPWLADYDETDLSEAQKARDGLTFFPGILLIILADMVIFYGGMLLLGPTIQLPIVLYASQPLLLIAVSDFRARIIPDQLIAAMIPGGILLWVADSLKNNSLWLTGLPTRLLAALAAGLFLWASGWLATRWLHRDAMGMGDVKLLAASAFLVDLSNVLFLFCLSFVLAALVAIPLLIRRRLRPESDPELAFGPYIVFATLILLLMEPVIQQLWQAYLALLM